MIKRLKTKFTVLATVSTLVLMTVLVGGMNLINYTTVINEADSTIEVLAKDSFMMNEEHPKPSIDNHIEELPKGMSPEVPYESRFFSVTVNKEGAIVDTDISRIISVDAESVNDYLEKAIESDKESGFVSQFRFLKTESGNGTKIVFLDCGRKLDAFYRFLIISSSFALFGCIVVAVLFIFASGVIVKPIAESYNKQRRFITDAGHEIKTPLTIISANTDLLESDIGANESLADIKAQTKRLAKLTGDLVYLSKMEETGRKEINVEFPISDLISDVASSFRALAGDKNYSVSVEPDLSFNGSPDETERLADILIENAFKYSDDDGKIEVTLAKEKKSISFSVYNTTKNKIDEKEIPQLFERFYRADSSRNSSTGGYGIGLSMAAAIVQKQCGKIYASTTNGYDFKITVLFQK